MKKFLVISVLAASFAAPAFAVDATTASNINEKRQEKTARELGVKATAAVPSAEAREAVKANNNAAANAAAANANARMENTGSENNRSGHTNPY